MSDPFSTVSAVVSLVDTGTQVSLKLIHFILSLSKAPDSLLDLSNQVTNLRRVLDQVHAAELSIRSRHAEQDAQFLTALQPQIDQAKACLNKLSAHIDKFQQPKSLRQRTKWVWKQSFVTKVQIELREIRQKILELMAAYSVSRGHRFELAFHSLDANGKALERDILALQQSQNDAFLSLHADFKIIDSRGQNALQAAQNNITEQLNNLQEDQSQSVSASTATVIGTITDSQQEMSSKIQLSIEDTRDYVSRRLDVIQQGNDHQESMIRKILTLQQQSCCQSSLNSHLRRSDITQLARMPSNFQQLKETRTHVIVATFQQRQNHCSRDCACKCHISCQSQARFNLNFLPCMLGRLAGGFHGFPFVGSSCDNSRCRSNRGRFLKATYVFPAWLLRYSAHLTVEMSSARGLNFSLRSKRRIQGRSDNVLFDAVFCGDVKLVQQILRDQPGLATDITDEGGLTLAGWFYQNVRVNEPEIWRVLLGSGVDPYAEDDDGFCPMDWIAKERLLFDKTCVNKWHDEVFVVPYWYYEHELDWTYLHKLQLGWYQTNIQDVLQDSDPHVLRDLNVQDKFGLTPLAFAAQRGDGFATRALLAAGARTDIGSPHLPQKIPIFQSLWIRSSNVFWEFVRAGSDIHVEDSGGWNLLHLACSRQSSTEIIKFLLANGIKSQDAGEVGVSPFIIALDDNYSDALQLFLAEGADPNWTDANGETALMRAIRWKADKSVELLLKHGADYTRKDSHGQTILHYVSKAKKPRIFAVLAAHGLVGLDIDAESRAGWSPMSLVPCAPNQRAFVRLLCAVEAANARAAALKGANWSTSVKKLTPRYVSQMNDEDSDSWETDSEDSSESPEADSADDMPRGTDSSDGDVPHIQYKDDGLEDSEEEEWFDAD